MRRATAALIVGVLATTALYSQVGEEPNKVFADLPFGISWQDQTDEVRERITSAILLDTNVSGGQVIATGPTSWHGIRTDVVGLNFSSGDNSGLAFVKGHFQEQEGWSLVSIYEHLYKQLTKDLGTPEPDFSPETVSVLRSERNDAQITVMVLKGEVTMNSLWVTPTHTAELTFDSTGAQAVLFVSDNARYNR